MRRRFYWGIGWGEEGGVCPTFLFFKFLRTEIIYNSNINIHIYIYIRPRCRTKVLLVLKFGEAWGGQDNNQFQNLPIQNDFLNFG